MKCFKLSTNKKVNALGINLFQIECKKGCLKIGCFEFSFLEWK